MGVTQTAGSQKKGGFYRYPVEVECHVSWLRAINNTKYDDNTLLGKIKKALRRLFAYYPRGLYERWMRERIAQDQEKKK